MKKVLSPISETKIRPNAAVKPCQTGTQRSGGCIEKGVKGTLWRSSATRRLGEDVNNGVLRPGHESHGRLRQVGRRSCQSGEA